MVARRYDLDEFLAVIISDQGAVNIISSGAITQNGQPIGSSDISFGAGDPVALGPVSPGDSPHAARLNHRHPMPTADQVGAIPLSMRNQANGVAGLDADGNLMGLPTIPKTAADVGAIPVAMLGAASGVADLDGQGYLPLNRLSFTPLELGNTDPKPLAAAAGPGTTGKAADAGHVHKLPTPAELGVVALAAVGDVNGVVPLDENRKIPQIYLPPQAGLRLDAESAPSPLGAATAGDSAYAAPANHVHAMPTAEALGALERALWNAPNGVAGLDSAGKLRADQVPLVSMATGLPVNFTTRQLDVPTTAATRLDDVTDTDDIYLLQNLGYTDIYIGGTSAVSAQTGFRLAVEDDFRITLEPGQELWVIAAGGAGTLGLMQGH